MILGNSKKTGTEWHFFHVFAKRSESDRISCRYWISVGFKSEHEFEFYHSMVYCVFQKKPQVMIIRFVLRSDRRAGTIRVRKMYNLLKHCSRAKRRINSIESDCILEFSVDYFTEFPVSLNFLFHWIFIISSSTLLSHLHSKFLWLATDSNSSEHWKKNTLIFHR